METAPQAQAVAHTQASQAQAAQVARWGQF